MIIPKSFGDILWPRGRWPRLFRLSAVIGGILLCASPAVCSYNDSVCDLRGDVASTAYFMRQDIEGLFIGGGIYLLIGGVFGVFSLALVRGHWAQRNAAAGALGVYAFAVMTITKACVAIPFLGQIYSSNGGDPMSWDAHLRLSTTVLVAGLVAYCGLLWPMLRTAKHAKTQKRACVECGYDLTGNQSGICPECGTTVESHARAAWAATILRLLPMDFAATGGLSNAAAWWLGGCVFHVFVVLVYSLIVASVFGCGADAPHRQIGRDFGVTVSLVGSLPVFGALWGWLAFRRFHGKRSP